MSSALVLSAIVVAALLGVAFAARARHRLHARLGHVARAGHELRGALSAMGLALSRMEVSDDHATSHRSIEALRSQHERALLATEDLQAAGADTGDAGVEPSAIVDLEVLVRRCARAWAAAHGRWRIVLDWRAGRPAVWGHAGRLGQALDNLVANALEHGAGPVTIVGRLSATSVTIAVLDRGEGLRHSLERAAPASWRARRGHGLVIVRRAVADHGGRIQLVRESRGTGVPDLPAARARIAGIGFDRRRRARHRPAGDRPLGMTRRRRGLAMLGLAGVCAGLAATSVDRYADDVAAQVGPLREVVVARRTLSRGTFVTAAVARTAFERRRVPSRFAPPRSLSAPREAVGYRTLAPMSAGDYVSVTQLGAPRTAARPGGGGRIGRLVEVAVTGAGTIAPLLRPGTLVDVLVTTDAQSGSPRTYLALQRLELVEFSGSPPAGAQDGADATATLRTTLRQAATLTAAQNFAREVRVVPRPRGDVRRLGPTSVTATGLAP